GVAVTTTSQNYGGLTMDTAVVARLMAKFLQANQVLELSQKIAAIDTNSPFFYNDAVTGPVDFSDTAEMQNGLIQGNGHATLETMRGGIVRLTLDYGPFTLLSTASSFEGTIHYQAPMAGGKSVVFIGPPVRIVDRTLHQILVWIQADRPLAADSTLAWVEDNVQAGAMPPEVPRVFHPMSALFADGVWASLLDVRKQQDEWNADLRLRGKLSDSYKTSVLCRLDPPAFAWADLELWRADQVRVTWEYPWFQTSTTLRLGIGSAPWRQAGDIPAADVGIPETLDLVNPPITVTIASINSAKEPNYGGWKSDVQAVTGNVGDRFNVIISVIDRDGHEAQPTHAQHDFGWRQDGAQWTTSFGIAPGDIARVRVNVQPMEWVEFRDIPLIASDQNPAHQSVVSTPPAQMPSPATGSAAPLEHFAPDSPEACVLAADAAIDHGDMKTAMSFVYARTPQEKEVAEVMYLDLSSEIKLRQAADAVFDKAEVARNHVGLDANPSIPLRYRVNGDIATPIAEPNAITAGPAQLRRVDGKWKVDMTVLGLDDPAKAAEINQQLQYGRRMADVADEVAKEIAGGQYDTVAEVALAIATKEAAIRQGATRP
ncbi:MAG TPA: hypothetical protein VMD30_01465, partial [Tepidisphaeraceae bacterium]|nr:hypothetical protein [Tepidisphaeraceae bacterium]